MITRCLQLLGVVALLVLPRASVFGPQPAQAAQSRYDNVIYTAPAGWQRLEQPNDILFIAPAAKSGAAALGILRGRTFSGNFRTWFDAAIKASLSAGERIVDHTADTATRGESAYDVLYTLQVVQEQSGARSYHFYLAAHPGNRVEMIVYFATSKDAFSAHQKVLADFLGSLHFANVTVPEHRPASAPTPSAGQGTTTGAGGVTIYFGEKTDFVFVPNILSPGGGNYQYQTRKYFYVFLRGARVYNGLPAAANLAHACDGRDTDHCGSYSSNGQQVNIVWDNGSSQQLTRSGDGADLHLGSITLNRMLPAPAGLTLNGVFGFTTSIDTTGIGGSGSVSGDHTIAFSSNGAFTLKDFVGSVVSGGSVGSTTSSQASGSGTYRLDGYTVQLSFSSGKVERHVFFALPGQGAIDAIAIDGAIYFRRS